MYDDNALTGILNLKLEVYKVEHVVEFVGRATKTVLDCQFDNLIVQTLGSNIPREQKNT